MAEEETQIVALNDDFYRDSFLKFVSILFSYCAFIVIIVASSLYLFFSKPTPITFSVGDEWRVVHPVPVNQPYLTEANMLQWVSETLPESFVYDFLDYNDQLKTASANFTTDGWKVFLNQLNNYVNYNKVQSDRLFITAVPTGAPYVLNQGMISGRYGWWVQMPIEITYTNHLRQTKKPITLQLLVVRVPITNNLNGIAFDNVIIAKDSSALPDAGEGKV